MYGDSPLRPLSYPELTTSITGERDVCIVFYWEKGSLLERGDKVKILGTFSHGPTNRSGLRRLLKL